jgi:hypothetical protein
MKKITLASLGAIFPVVLTCALASAATTTSTDVRTLSGAESKVVALLDHYQPTSAWKAQFKAAEALQASDLAKINAALWPEPSQQTVGSTQDVVSESGPYSVTLLAVETVQADDSDANTRSVAAKFRVTDIGKHAVSDSPDNGVSLIGDNGQGYSWPGLIAPTCSDFGPHSNFNLAPGESVVGCVVVEVPDGVRIVRVKWVPDGGNGPNIHSWVVPKK